MTAPHRSPTPPEVRRERDRIRALLLTDRPDLSPRLQTGPSGALLIPLPGGSIEIGRMRRRGRMRWVVVTPDGDGARVREPGSLTAVAGTALAALAGRDHLAGPRRITSHRSC